MKNVCTLSKYSIVYYRPVYLFDYINFENLLKLEVFQKTINCMNCIIINLNIFNFNL